MISTMLASIAFVYGSICAAFLLSILRPKRF